MSFDYREKKGSLSRFSTRARGIEGQKEKREEIRRREGRFIQRTRVGDSTRRFAAANITAQRAGYDALHAAKLFSHSS